MTQPSPSVLFLSKTHSWCHAARDFLQNHIEDVTVVEGERHDPRPELLASWSGDYLISFLGPWVVPQATLARVKRAALNFHPAPPEYPGIGCYNFALYDAASEYGVTCHLMAPTVDSGEIVKVIRFPLLSNDTVSSLKTRSMAYLMVLFYDVAVEIIRGEPIRGCGEHWTRKPYTRRELDELCRIDPAMPRAEAHRRVKATTFPGAPGAFVELHGLRFERNAAGIPCGAKTDDS